MFADELRNRDRQMHEQSKSQLGIIMVVSVVAGILLAKLQAGMR